MLLQSIVFLHPVFLRIPRLELRLPPMLSVELAKLRELRNPTFSTLPLLPELLLQVLILLPVLEGLEHFVLERLTVNIDLLPLVGGLAAVTAAQDVLGVLVDDAGGGDQDLEDHDGVAGAVAEVHPDNGSAEVWQQVVLTPF